MKFKPFLQCHHDLKKNGYKIIKKLHKLESRKNLDSIYLMKCKEGYFFVLSCKNLFNIICMQYNSNDSIVSQFKKFDSKSNMFLHHLETIAQNQMRINKHILASYLSAYTKFFNFIIAQQIPFHMSQDDIVYWNSKCIMAYYAAWKK